MSYLEKLFVATLALSFLLMGFMFALYFDVGDMIYGKFAKGSSFRAALADSAIALLEHEANTRTAGDETGAAYVFRNEDFGVPESQHDFVASFAPPPVPGDTFNDLRRAELRRMGVTNNEYIEMEAQGKDRSLYEQTVASVDGLLERDEFDRAIAEVNAAIGATSAQNLYVLRDLWAHLMNVCYVAKRPEDAKAATMKYLELQEKILKLRQAAGAPVAQTEWDRLQQLKASIEPWFAQVARGEVQPQTTRDALKPTVGEKVKAREQLEAALRRGEVSREEYERVKSGLGL